MCYVLSRAMTRDKTGSTNMANTAKTADTATKKVETKAEKFQRLAPPRIQKALDAIGLIGNLSAKGNYEYTPDQVAKIKAALDAKVSSVMAGFSPDAKGPTNQGFSF